MDEYRRLPNLRRDDLTEVLPSHFFDEYPLLVKLFEYYFEYLRSEESPSAEVRDLFKNRDISAVSEDLLQYLQAELLLGVDYFQGFSNPRDALKLNNILYNSKGSRYSIQQFFRYFFGIDPEVIYTKNNVFIVGESEIGYESQRFITNDKLYQTFAVLIKTPLSLNQWKDVYKLFVHPAGVYLGAEVQLVGVADLSIDAPVAIPRTETGPTISGTANIGLSAYGEKTVIE